MSMRIRRSLYIFNRPFFLEISGRMYPAGTYRIETQDDVVDGIPSEAYRHVTMTMTQQPQVAGAPLEIEQVNRWELAAAIVTSQFRRDVVA